jgi:CheY-like chemotaxis protein
MSALPVYDFDSYVTPCSGCAQQFDAMTALWCRCVTKDPSVACPYCGHCVCKDGRLAMRDFWQNAPRILHARRADEKARRKTNGSLHPRTATKVLVVDDDEEIRVITEYALREMGYDTATASGPAQAMEAIERERPSVVLTDALMPGGDGRELCKTIKTRYPNLRVIVMTSLYTSGRYASEAYRVFGADAYMAKPIDFDRLRAALGRLVVAS